ncbi:hypothetical protein MH1LPH_27610 [Lactiplantibacillus brownii]
MSLYDVLMFKILVIMSLNFEYLIRELSLWLGTFLIFYTNQSAPTHMSSIDSSAKQ